MGRFSFVSAFYFREKRVNGRWITKERASKKNGKNKERTSVSHR